MKRKTPEGLAKAAADVLHAWDVSLRRLPKETVATGMGWAISNLRLALGGETFRIVPDADGGRT